MLLYKTRLYGYLLTACIAGYIWLYYNISQTSSGSHSIQVCPIKKTTSIPCPSCGSTRAVVALMKGEILESFYINPLGILVALIMLIIPFWILIDLTTKRKSLFDFYFQIETFLKKPKVAASLLLLVVINWIWNIAKGL